ncbi:hypothetical protein VCHA50O407_20352 [Vibrio chagasii]|nr:hypothetical protein VCHA50O407_20352 [Vibrio chagasii]CAH7231695.1 hypothetical protein VCHA40P240_30150 [Vibrio chagasii]CAH7314582.1 hypothetical protein VCHA50P424_30493 [Vibrio chagasii]
MHASPYDAWIVGVTGVNEKVGDKESLEAKVKKLIKNGLSLQAD